ncbi:Gp15 family bacteriophage protein [Enterococcus dispar]
MFSLYYKQNDFYEIEGTIYPVNASFDNILKLIDMTRDKSLATNYRVVLGIKMLFGKETNLIQAYPFQHLNDIFLDVFKIYVNQGKEPEIKKDLAGNPLPPEFQKDKESSYSLKYDAEYIYASFMQAYGIDLVEEQGKLHWFKFQALLAGLPEDTKFRQVVSIRLWKKPSKSDTEESQMRELQEIYRLPDEESEVEE